MTQTLLIINAIIIIGLIISNLIFVTKLLNRKSELQSDNIHKRFKEFEEFLDECNESIDRINNKLQSEVNQFKKSNTNDIEKLKKYVDERIRHINDKFFKVINLDK